MSIPLLKMSSEKPVHVLMVSAAFQGHMNSTLNLAKRLLSKGLRVTLITTEDSRHRLLNFSDPNIQLHFFSDGLPLDFDRSAHISTVIHSLKTTGPQNLSNLITHLTKQQNYNFSCLVITPFMPWAANVASSHGIPCTLLWFQASAIYSIYYRFVKKINPFPSLENLDEKLQLPGLPVLEARDLPSYILPSCPYDYKKVMWDLFHVLDKLKWVLGTSVYEFEEEVVKSMASLTPILPIGPLVSPYLLGEDSKEEGTTTLNLNLWKVQDSCLEWLDNKPPSSVVYVAFGSLVVLSQKQIDNIAIALKNSERPFLWAIRPSEKDSEQKGGELPRGFSEETIGRGLVVTWSPQEKVLTHPSVGCFLSHCGWNSTVEAVVAGVPVIAHPQFSDHPTNAKLVDSVFKNGVKTRVGEDGVVEAQEMERCIWEVMEGPKAGEIKKRATELKLAARKALAQGGSSDANINRFVSEIVRVSS